MIVEGQDAANCRMREVPRRNRTRLAPQYGIVKHIAVHNLLQPKFRQQGLVIVIDRDFASASVHQFRQVHGDELGAVAVDALGSRAPLQPGAGGHTYKVYLNFLCHFILLRGSRKLIKIKANEFLQERIGKT